MPQIIFTDRASVPEGIDVKETEDGKFVIDVVNKAKLDEFRENNVNLAKERDTLRKFHESVAPIVGEDLEAFQTNYAELSGTAQKVKDGKLKGTDAIEAEVENRTKSMREDYDRQLSLKANEAKAAADAAKDWQGKFKRTQIDQAITQAAIKPEYGVENTAIPDLLHRAYSIFSVKDDGNVVPMDGEAIVYGSDGATPMTPDEWVKGLQKTAPHMFKRSAGGGAEGGLNKGIKGMSSADLAKLSPQAKMELARKQSK